MSDREFVNFNGEDQSGDNKSDKEAGKSKTLKIFENGRASQGKRAMSMKVSDKMNNSLDNERFHTGVHNEEEFKISKNASIFNTSQDLAGIKSSPLLPRQESSSFSDTP